MSILVTKSAADNWNRNNNKENARYWHMCNASLHTGIQKNVCREVILRCHHIWFLMVRLAQKTDWIAKW